MRATHYSVGRYHAVTEVGGDFDLLASSAIKRAIRNYAYDNAHFTLVLPYMKAEYRDNE